MIGRRRELEALDALFNDGARLVSIVGPGGMGKTTLAHRFTAEQVGLYGESGDGGSWFCELGGIESPQGFSVAIAEALGIRLSPTEDSHRLVRELAAKLARRGRLLLVLDNVEQLAPLAAETIAPLVGTAPRLRLLVTTRVALDLAEEHRFPLEGLPLGSSELPEDLSDAAQLFERRARQVRPDLFLDASSRPTIAAIVRDLSGIPLAIELAASKASILSLPQILERITGRERLSRTQGAMRHSSVGAVVIDSLRLLSGEARLCLRAASVFRGGFSLEALEYVAGETLDATASGAPQNASLSTARLLEQLVNHSLVRVLFEGEEKAPRYAIYEVIRAELESELGDSQTEMDHHLRYFVARARSGDPSSRRLDVDNFQIAFDRASARGDDSAMLAIVFVLHDLYTARSDHVASLVGLDAVLRNKKPASTEIAEAFVRRGIVRTTLGDLLKAEGELTAGIAMAEEVEAKAIAALGHASLGVLIELHGDTRRAREAYQRALQFLDAAPERESAGLRAKIHAGLAHAARREGTLAEAEHEIGIARELYRSANDEAGTLAMLSEGAIVSLFRKEYERARNLLAEALVRAKEHRVRDREAAILTVQGTLEQELEGDLPARLDRAAQLHQSALAIFRSTGHAYAESATLYYLGGCHLERGQVDDALRLFEMALSGIRRLRVPRYEALILSAIGALHARRSELTRATECFTLAEKMAADCPDEPSLHATLSIHKLHIEFSDAAVKEGERLAAAAPCDDPRFALRILKGRRSHAPEEVQALLIRGDGFAFRASGQANWTDLTKRTTLARILSTMAKTRIDSPGVGLSVEEILEAGWPDERVRYDAATNRVYVALAELRRLGLREWILTEPSGYRLTTDAQVSYQEA